MLSKPLVLSMMAIAALSGCLEAVDDAGGKTVTMPGAATTRSVSPRTLQTGSDRLVDLPSGAISLGGTTFSDSVSRISLEDTTSDLFVSTVGTRNLFSISTGDPATKSTSAFIVGTSNLSQELAGSRIIRAGTSTLPTGGTASYSGDYAGIAFEQYSTPSQAAYALTSGDVSLITSFTNNTVTGKITNRQAFSTDGTRDTNWSAASIGINLATLTTNGDYQATLSGGGLSQVGDATTTNNGQVNGIIGGTNGQSTAGTLFLNHSMTGSNGNFALTERGAFSADR
jgi:hypothetical protein